MLVFALFLAMQAVAATPGDLCSNIQGLQVEIPAGMASIDGLCFIATDIVLVTPETAPTPPAASPVKPTKAPKPKVDLGITPTGFLTQDMWHPKVFQLHLVVVDATGELWCPALRWKWPGGTESFQEGDCQPYELTPAKERARQSWSKYAPVPLPSGDWTFEVQLEKPAGTVVARATVVGHVAGAE